MTVVTPEELAKFSTLERKRLRIRTSKDYWGNNHTPRERMWYICLADKVGHLQAPKYADDIINWKQSRPPDHILQQWLIDYDDGKHIVDEAVRARVEAKVDRFHKQEHVTFLRQMMKAGKKAMEPVEEAGDMKQPVILKYIADGVNQGMLMHNARNQPVEALSLGGLTINVGQRPPPRKLRQKEVDQIIEGDFKVLKGANIGSADGN